MDHQLPVVVTDGAETHTETGTEAGNEAGAEAETEASAEGNVDASAEFDLVLTLEQRLCLGSLLLRGNMFTTSILPTRNSF